ncbi:MAG: ABC transporter ATP-binding protein [bacterium]|nr:ABC transporter ATP-binding protein [bacterium]
MTLSRRTASDIITTEKLTKVYSGSKKALDSLDLNVEQGEVFGYLGPNGAGKTTTIRLLLDLIRPTSGRAALFGLDATADSEAVRARIGYLPAELNLWNHLTALDVVRYMARLRGLGDIGFARQLGERLAFDFNKRVKSFSTGNKRKLGLILAFMHKPELLILDEPSSGLDPLMQQTFNQLVMEAKANGQTVFLSSHVLGEVQAICDRVAILRHGQLQEVARVDSLTHAHVRYVSLRLREPIPAELFAGLPGASDVRIDGSAAQFQYRGDIDPLLRAFAPYYVEDLRLHEPTLEEIFLTFYGDAPAAEGRENGQAPHNSALSGAHKEAVR